MNTRQTDAIATLSAHVGATVQVATSEYLANVSPHFKPVGTVNASTLRSLERQGFIRIVRAYWKGATVEVLRAA